MLCKVCHKNIADIHSGCCSPECETILLVKDHEKRIKELEDKIGN